MKNKLIKTLTIGLFGALSFSFATPTNDKVTEVKADFSPVPVSQYYSSITSNMKGDTLKVALYNIIKGHEMQNYNTLEWAMKQTDRNWEVSPDPDDQNPIMWLLYADYNNDSSKRSDFNHFHGGGANGGVSSGYIWNKEHIWAKNNGFGNASSSPAYSDLHHLRASDWKLNNTRTNNPFANGGSYTEDCYGDLSTCKTTSSTFEPSDQYKGDVARALFYMATRYYSGDGSNNTSLGLTTGTDSSGGKWGYLDTLLAWHELDPVDSFESNRNQMIYEDYQHNRNPYIDHPEYARAVFKNEPIVEPKALTNLVCTGTPTQKNYKEGASFNPNGLTVTAYFDDDSHEVVTSSIIWDKVTTSSVTGRYIYGSNTLSVTVSGLTVISMTGLEKEGNLNTTIFDEGSTFDPTGLSIYARYSDNSRENVTSNITWSPSTLSYGTTTVTGTYSSFNITVGDLLVRKVSQTGYTIKFADSSSDGSSEINAAAIKNKISEGATYVTSISNQSKVFEGKTGLKLGSSSASGTFTINLSNSGKVTSTSIKVATKKYGTDTGNIVIKVNGTQVGTVTPGSNVSEGEVTFSSTTLSTITVSTSTKRAYVSYLTISTGSSGDSDIIQTWIDSYMHMDDPNYSGSGTGLCISLETYLTAKRVLMSLDIENRNNFENNTGNKYTDALNRYLAWARANHDDSPFSGSTIYILFSTEIVYNSAQVYIIFIVVASISITMLGAILILRKKRR